MMLCDLFSNKGMVWFVRPKPDLKLCSFTKPILLLLYTKFQLPIRGARVRKICTNLECTVEIRATVHARDGSASSSGAVFPGAFERRAWARS
jgi:hypothetical protein